MKRLIMLVVLFAAAGLLFFATGSAVAAEYGDCMQRFNKYDINHDGVVTPDEYKMTYGEGQYMGTAVPPAVNPSFVEFDSLDMGGKGYLTEADFCTGGR